MTISWLADKIEQWPTAKLVPYARNSRTHSDAQVAQIAASIAEFGFTNPILAGGDGVIVAGHGRLAAAQKLGLAMVPDDGRDIANELTTRMGPSLAIALPTFVLGLFVTVCFALLLVFFRASYLDFWGVVLCVAMMSISGLFYIIGGQSLVSKVWHLVPISGYGAGLDAGRFLVLPVVIGVIAGIGGSARWYRTIFLEEIGKDYVRTARAKGFAAICV